MAANTENPDNTDSTADTANRYCPSCGVAHDGTAPFCGKCGTALAGSPQQPPHAQIVIGGAGAIILGSFLPWVSIGFVSASGVDGGDGWLTVIGGGVLLWLGFRMMQRRSMAPAAAGTALAVAALVVYEFVNISRERSVGEGDFAFEISASPAAGLYLCAAGALAALWASVIAWRRSRP